MLAASSGAPCETAWMRMVWFTPHWVQRSVSAHLPGDELSGDSSPTIWSPHKRDTAIWAYGLTAPTRPSACISIVFAGCGRCCSRVSYLLKWCVLLARVTCCVLSAIYRVIDTCHLMRNTKVATQVLRVGGHLKMPEHTTCGNKCRYTPHVVKNATEQYVFKTCGFSPCHYATPKQTWNGNGNVRHRCWCWCYLCGRLSAPADEAWWSIATFQPRRIRCSSA